jgi:hypothetical protein
MEAKKQWDNSFNALKGNRSCQSRALSAILVFENEKNIKTFLDKQKHTVCH